MAGTSKCDTCGYESDTFLQITAVSRYCYRCGTIFNVGGPTPPYVPDLIRRLRTLATTYRDDERVSSLLNRFGITELIGKEEESHVTDS